MTGKNNIQDLILNTVRKEKSELTIYLTNGVPLKGKVTSFDNFTIILDQNGKQNLVYKHAISTIIPSKAISIYTEANPEEQSS